MTLAERVQLARADEQMTVPLGALLDDHPRRPRSPCRRCHQKKYAVRDGYCARCKWLVSEGK